MADSTKKPLHIAIDGPVASGKSTVCALVARELDLFYVDTGIMYRAVALAALRQDADIESDAACGAIAEHLPLHLEPPTSHHQQPTVYLNGEDVTDRIREADVNHIVSRVSSHPAVRRAMHVVQRKIAAHQGVIMAGRDIAEIVLPQAQVKILLTASLDVRVKRRAMEIAQKKPGAIIDLDALRTEIERRDALDSVQMHSPPETIIIDTDSLTEAQVVARILEVVDERTR